MQGLHESEDQWSLGTSEDLSVEDMMTDPDMDINLEDLWVEVDAKSAAESRRLQCGSMSVEDPDFIPLIIPGLMPAKCDQPCVMTPVKSEHSKPMTRSLSPLPTRSPARKRTADDRPEAHAVHNIPPKAAKKMRMSTQPKKPEQRKPKQNKKSKTETGGATKGAKPSKGKSRLQNGNMSGRKPDPVKAEAEHKVQEEPKQLKTQDKYKPSNTQSQGRVQEEPKAFKTQDTSQLPKTQSQTKPQQHPKPCAPDLQDDEPANAGNRKTLQRIAMLLKKLDGLLIEVKTCAVKQGRSKLLWYGNRKDLAITEIGIKPGKYEQLQRCIGAEMANRRRQDGKIQFFRTYKFVPSIPGHWKESPRWLLNSEGLKRLALAQLKPDKG